MPKNNETLTLVRWSMFPWFWQASLSWHLNFRSVTLIHPSLPPQTGWARYLWRCLEGPYHHINEPKFSKPLIIWRSGTTTSLKVSVDNILDVKHAQTVCINFFIWYLDNNVMVLPVASGLEEDDLRERENRFLVPWIVISTSLHSFQLAQTTIKTKYTLTRKGSVLQCGAFIMSTEKRTQGWSGSVT